MTELEMLSALQSDGLPAEVTMCPEIQPHKPDCECSACLARKEGKPLPHNEWAKGYREGVKDTEDRYRRRNWGMW